MYSQRLSVQPRAQTDNAVTLSTYTLERKFEGRHLSLHLRLRLRLLRLRLCLSSAQCACLRLRLRQSAGASATFSTERLCCSCLHLQKLVAQKLQELVDRQAVELKKLQAESDRWKAQFYNLYDSSAYPNDHFYCIRCAQEFLVGAVEACPHYCHDCELWKDGPDGCGCAMSESSSDASDSE